MTSSPSTTYSFLGASKFGPPEKVLQFGESNELPKWSDDSAEEVLIRVEYAELNPVDLQKLNGGPRSGQDVPDPPMVVGYGGSGTVVQVNNAGSSSTNTGGGGDNDGDLLKDESLQVDDKVIFLADPRRKGALATHVVCNVRSVCKLTAAMETEKAAAIPLAGCTALESLDKLNLDSGAESILIVGGAGGVGSWATRLVRSMHPKITTIHCTASSLESKAWCRHYEGFLRQWCQSHRSRSGRSILRRRRCDRWRLDYQKL